MHKFLDSIFNHTIAPRSSFSIKILIKYTDDITRSTFLGCFCCRFALFSNSYGWYHKNSIQFTTEILHNTILFVDAKFLSTVQEPHSCATPIDLFYNIFCDLSPYPVENDNFKKRARVKALLHRQSHSTQLGMGERYGGCGTPTTTLAVEKIYTQSSNNTSDRPTWMDVPIITKYSSKHTATSDSTLLHSPRVCDQRPLIIISNR